MRRYLGPAVASLALLGCLNSFDNGSPVIPDGVPVYRMVPSLLQYSLRDTSTGQDLLLHWLSAPPITYAGYNCLGLQPTTPTDTTGTFLFAFNGANVGRIERTGFGVTDTTVGYFFPEQGAEQGTHGTWVLESNGNLALHWLDGLQSRYFQAGAVIRLVNDTITSDVDVLTRGDSVREQWHVVWAFDGLNGC